MKDQTMTPEQIKNLHEAALTVATSLLAVMPEANAEYLERAIGAGGRIVLELGPLPDMRRVSLAVVEPEGNRVIVCTQSWEIATLQ